MENHDVLLIESRPGVGQTQRQLLGEAGHRVRSCYRSGSTGFPCVAVESAGSCPLDDGIDAALVVLGAEDEPTAFETGASCALRAGVPLVVTGTENAGRFGPYCAAEPHSDPRQAVAAGVESRRRSIESEVQRVAEPVVRSEGFDPADITVKLTREDRTLRMRLTGPPIGDRGQRTICVRALDVIRGNEGPATVVDVSYVTSTAS